MRFDRDAFVNVNLKEVSRASFSIIDALQSYSAETKVAALCAVFKLYSDFVDMRIPEAFEVVNNIMNHGEGRRPEFKAIESYLEHEMR